jgi:branched-chain amino acid transport system substrate-binding protein
MYAIRRRGVAVAVGLVLAAGSWGAAAGTTTAPAAAAVRTSTAATGGTSGTSQGITATTVTVGSVSTQSGPIAADSSGLIYGEKAYFDYIDATGGVNGRRIDYAYVENDDGDPTTFNQMAATLIEQDKVFAVTGVATVYFSPNLFTESGIPTFGYNVTGNWAGPTNLFAAGGSALCYQCGVPAWSYVVQKTHHRKIGILAYNFSTSAHPCAVAAAGFTAAGDDVVYQDLAVAYPASTVATDIERMRQDGVNFVLSCMDVTGNVAMARAIKQYGLQTTQLWLNGNDQTTLDQYSDVMQGVYFNIFNVPLDASTSVYPGLKLYLTEMNRYEPAWTDSGLAMDGWQSAALFVESLRAAGRNPTWQKVIADANGLTNFTADGLVAPVNWKAAGHSGINYPSCSVFIQVKGKKFVTVFAHGAQVFNCWGPSVKNPTPVKSPVGTPGTTGSDPATADPAG